MLALEWDKLFILMAKGGNRGKTANKDGLFIFVVLGTESGTSRMESKCSISEHLLKVIQSHVVRVGRKSLDFLVTIPWPSLWPDGKQRIWLIMTTDLCPGSEPEMFSSKKQLLVWRKSSNLKGTCDILPGGTCVHHFYCPSFPTPKMDKRKSILGETKVPLLNPFWTSFLYVM